MRKFFLSLVLAAALACMAAPFAFAEDTGAASGGGSSVASGVGREDIISTPETATGVGRDDVLAFGGEMKDSVDKYGGGLGKGIDHAKEMWDKTVSGLTRYAMFFADSMGEILWHDPVFMLFLAISIVGVVALGVIRALTS